MGTDQSTDRRLSRVERVIETYDLDGFGGQLTDRWTVPESSSSLRDLVDLMNEKVLDAVLRKTDEDVLGGEVKNLYTLLTGDEATEGMRVQAKNTPWSRGVDVDQLFSDFVSHQAVYTHLTDIHGISKDSSSGNRIGSAIESIQRLHGRLVTVVEQSLSSLRNTNELRLGDFDVFVDTQVYCRSYGM